MFNKNTTDKTTERNYLARMYYLVKEYELTKEGKHPRYRFAADFYKANNLTKQNFIKYYHRYKEVNNNTAFIPRKRGPKYTTRRPVNFIEKQVVNIRITGANRYEIHEILKNKLKQFTPSPSGIYNICKRYGLNKLKKQEKENKRRIIKNKTGELAHIDCHYLPKSIIMNNDKRLYILGVVDDYSRIAWCEVIDDIQSLTVMFAIMRCLKILKSNYDIEFIEVMTDNGPEFGGNANNKHGNNDDNIMTNPVKRLFYEIGVKHRKIKPYHPQTNGKIERFWRSIEEDFIEETIFESREELNEELFKYMIYYNEYRPHQGINGLKPIEMLDEEVRKRLNIINADELYDYDENNKNNKNNEC